MATRLRVVNKVSEFEQTRARWAEVSAARRALKDRVDGCRAALAFADHRPSPGEHFSPVLEDRARRYLDGRTPDRDRLVRQLSELEAEMADAATVFALESAAWRTALEAEADRRAAALRPRHKAAVRRIAQLVEQLSLAVEAERAVRAELAEVGGNGALPDAGREFGSLHEYGSTLSSWNRRMLAEGALDG
jgi:hypothetical protein